MNTLYLRSKSALIVALLLSVSFDLGASEPPSPFDQRSQQPGEFRNTVRELIMQNQQNVNGSARAPVRASQPNVPASRPVVQQPVQPEPAVKLPDQTEPTKDVEPEPNESDPSPYLRNIGVAVPNFVESPAMVGYFSVGGSSHAEIFYSDVVSTYQVGDTLPDGSILMFISPVKSTVTYENDDNEKTLPLTSIAAIENSRLRDLDERASAIQTATEIRRVQLTTPRRP